MTVTIKLEPKGNDLARAVRKLIVRDFQIHAVLSQPQCERPPAMQPPINDTTPPVPPQRAIR